MHSRRSRLLLIAAIAALSTSSAQAHVKVGESIVVVEEETTVEKGTYIPPNEAGAGVYRPLLEQKKGALLSIGTFRVLDRAAAGNFSQVFMLDYDRVATEFNKLNLELIKQSRNRYEYLQLLLGKRASPATLKALAGGAMSDASFVATLMHEEKPAFSLVGSPQQRVQQILERESPSLAHPTLREKLGHEIYTTLLTSELRDHSVFGSDVVFQGIKSQIEAGEIIPMLGSLTGKETLSSLGAALWRQDVEISVVDLSNAMDHITHFNPWTPEGMQSLINNLDRLPLAKDALILWSAHDHVFGIRDHSDQWVYFALTKDQFMRAAQLGYLDTSQGLFNLMKNIYQNRAPQNAMTERLMVPGPSYDLKERASLVRDWCQSQMTRILSGGVIRLGNFLFSRGR